MFLFMRRRFPLYLALGDEKASTIPVEVWEGKSSLPIKSRVSDEKIKNETHPLWQKTNAGDADIMPQRYE